MAKARFEWDPKKDKENREKHGVSFAKAQFAFADPHRVIAEDASHSSGEKRQYCFLGLGTGGKGGGCMNGKIRCTDEPLGKLRVVPDVLPSPEELVFRDEGVKVTIALSKRSVEFFKDQARKHHTQYQRMIRRLLDAYAEHHAQSGTARSTRGRAKVAHAG